ncbi:MAG: hypothetical protein LBR94_07350 [Desulfovibrio sp.]|nr:hypothetical protein [Desulfovibrio sp.]
MNAMNELNNLNEVVERLQVDLIGSAGRVNYYADKKDYGRNRVNYGCASCSADLLRRLGHVITLNTWGDDEGFLRNEKLTIDGKEIAVKHPSTRAAVAGA